MKRSGYWEGALEEMKCSDDEPQNGSVNRSLILSVPWGEVFYIVPKLSSIGSGVIEVLYRSKRTSDGP